MGCAYRWAWEIDVSSLTDLPLSRRRNKMLQKLKLTAVAAAVALGLGAGAAQADTVNSQLFGGLQLASDSSAEYLVNVAGGATTLDIGDRLVGIVTIEKLQQGLG